MVRWVARLDCDCVIGDLTTNRGVPVAGDRKLCNGKHGGHAPQISRVLDVITNQPEPRPEGNTE